jgi:tetratricopeptide (TPR) repeat protein
MKHRSLYIYLLLFFVSVATIIFIDRMINHKSDSANTNSKQDNTNNAAARLSRRLAEFKNAIDNNPQDTLKMREYANLLGGAHRDQEAAKVFENILAIGPNRIDVMLILTYIYYTLGNTEKAEEYTNRVLSINKDNPEANFNLGILELKKGDKEKAKQILNSVIKRFPNNNVALYAKSALQKL